jgi:hypothetical protein
MSHYRIMLRGVVKDRSVDEVVQALARYSKKPPDVLRSLLTSGRDVVAKRTAEVQYAMKYKQALENIGCICVIQAEITASSGTPTSDGSTSVLVTSFTTAQASTAAAREYQYAKPPLAVRMRGMTAWLGVTAMLAVAYFGWKNFY